MPRLLTPLVIISACAVLLFGALRAVLLPSAWPSSLAGMLFVPIVLFFLERMRRTRAEAGGEPKPLREVRAALVGASVLLAAAFLLSVTDALEITASEGSGRSAAVVLASVIAVFTDLLSSRLESAAEKDD